MLKPNVEHAVYLSGNGPLVKVLQEALARDEVAQARRAQKPANKASALRKAVSFVQNIHHFRDEGLSNPGPPVERVVVFDEAQRAWNRAQTSRFMREKRNQPDFDASEPEFLVRIMDRHLGWAVIVCLVGGGQEINTGEAGLAEWLRTIRDHFPHWRVHLPPGLDTSDYLADFKLEALSALSTPEPSLHLGVSIRSFRSETLSNAVSTLIEGNERATTEALRAVLPTYPIVATRSLDTARAWVQAHARGSERSGILASSGARRLKRFGINMEVKVDPCVWFLNDDFDVRSSQYLEDAASEFDVQGLELDWSIVAWDGDFIHTPEGWRCRNFRGRRWEEARLSDSQRFKRNAYRVLLTRARQGMVLYVPQGDAEDHTRTPDFYDPTWAFLRQIGIAELG